MLYYNADKRNNQQLTIVGVPKTEQQLPRRTATVKHKALAHTVRDWWLAIWHMKNDDHDDDEDDESWISQCYNCFILVLDTGN